MFFLLKNSDEFLTLYEERLQWPEYSEYTNNVYAPFGYDAAWAVALTLNKSAEILKTKQFSDNRTRRLEDFNYDDVEMGKLFFDLLAETDFIGATVSDLWGIYPSVNSIPVYVDQNASIFAWARYTRKQNNNYNNNVKLLQFENPMCALQTLS